MRAKSIGRKFQSASASEDSGTSSGISLSTFTSNPLHSDTGISNVTDTETGTGAGGGSSIAILNPLHTLDQTLLKLNIHEDTAEYIKNATKKHGMKKVLKWPELILLGVGATIGAGIFVVTGVVARDKTGPALPLSYVFSGIACLLSAFSYAEFAGMAPTAGSAYGYTRSTMGEFFGWVIGWDLVLEYAVSAAGVAQGFSGYLSSLLAIYGYHIPIEIATTPWGFDPETGKLAATGSYFDVIALIVTFFATLLLIRGIQETATLNAIMVVFKIGVCLFVIIVGALFVKKENFSPFMPYGFAGISFFGYTAVGQSDNQGNSVGVLAGASVVFFAYIGFDAVTTNAEECEKPQRDLPIGIIGSLVLSTILYVGVSIVLVGMVPFQKIDRSAPISAAFSHIPGSDGANKGLSQASQLIVSLGALAGLASVLLVNLMGQPRVLVAMARDGLLPYKLFTDLHPIYLTPYRSTALTGLCVAWVAALIPLSVLVELVSMGTLMAFMFVNISVIVLRRRSPHLPRPFLCPGFPYVPGLGALCCLTLMLSLPSSNWVRLVIWFAIGMAIYYGYGKKSAEMMRRREEESRREGGGGEGVLGLEGESGVSEAGSADADTREGGREGGREGRRETNDDDDNNNNGGDEDEKGGRLVSIDLGSSQQIHL
jgi:APA family basic amino acid/polyamine antiporter